MLNSKGIRELAYVVKVDHIVPIQGSDNCECACVGGWNVMVTKGTFQPGDLAVYFEIDSKVDVTKEEFKFLEKKHGVIKTQRYTFGGKGNFLSQGLLMSLGALGLTECNAGDFLTERLGVIYATPEDNKRKGSSKGNTKSNKCGIPWPKWIKKTDEERIQNIPFILEDEGDWIATEKIDGMSSTYAIEKVAREGFWGKIAEWFKKCLDIREYDLYIGSRNLIQDKARVKVNKAGEFKVFWNMEKDKKNKLANSKNTNKLANSKNTNKLANSKNTWVDIAIKYQLGNKLVKIIEASRDLALPYDKVVLQGEIYGKGIQKRDYHADSISFMGFNWIVYDLLSPEGKRMGVKESKEVWEKKGVPWVPVVWEGRFKDIGDVEEVLKFADGESVCDKEMREGLVFKREGREGDVVYGMYGGINSFKAVSNEYLMKWH